MTRRGWLLFGAMCLIWGVPYLLIRVSVEQLSPATLVFLRTGIGAILLLPLVRHREQWRLVLAKWPLVVLYTLVEVTLPWWLLTSAEQHLSSSLSGMIVAAVPLIGVLLNRLTGGDEQIDARRVTGLALGVAGVVVLVGLQIGTVDMVAVGAVLLTALGYAVGPILLSRTMSDLPGTTLVAASLGLSALVYAPEAALHWPHHLSGRVIGSVLGLAVVCTALAFIVFFALIRTAGPTRATVITFVNPAVALALGALVLGERITLAMSIGFPLVLLGSVLATRRPATDPIRAEIGTADTAADTEPQPGLAAKT